MEDHYRTLQIDPSAEPEIIEAAWRRLAKLYHPDGARPNPQRMKAINAAHDVLKDPARRAAYDRQRTSKSVRPAEPQRPAAPAQPRATVDEDAWQEWRPGQGAYEVGSGSGPTATPDIACWQHPDQPAVVYCGSCGDPLCYGCAEQWSPPHCARCVRRHARRREWQIVWPLAYAAAWLITAMLWSGFASGWGAVQPWQQLAQVGPSAAIGYFVGCGLVGVIDLTFGNRWRHRRLLPTGCLGVLVGIPFALAAGCVMAPIRSTSATIGWVRALRMAREAHAQLSGTG